MYRPRYYFFTSQSIAMLGNEFMAYLGTATPTRKRVTARVSTPILKEQPRPVPAPPAPAPSSLVLVPYSDRSFAIFGDTKPVKDKLTELGGNFNRFLKRDGVITPGWIFSNKRLDHVRQSINVTGS